MIEKLNATLYDLFGYLLPGCVALGALAIAEATLTDGQFLSIQNIRGQWVLFLLVAYYLGHAAQCLASALQAQLHAQFTSTKGRLCMPLYDRVKGEVRVRYGFSEHEMKDIHTLQVQQLCDTYTAMSSAAGERDILVSREGFYRGSMVAFGALFLILVIASFAGGAHFYLASNDVWALSRIETLLMAIGSLVLTLLMYGRFKFFNRLKNNFSQLVYLSSIEPPSSGRTPDVDAPPVRQ